MEDNQQFDIERSLGRIEGTLNGMEKHLERLNGKTDKNTARISKVENKMAFNKGKAAKIGASAGIGGGAGIMLLWEIVKSKIGM